MRLFLLNVGQVAYRATLNAKGLEQFLLNISRLRLVTSKVPGISLVAHGYKTINHAELMGWCLLFVKI